MVASAYACTSKTPCGACYHEWSELKCTYASSWLKAKSSASSESQTTTAMASEEDGSIDKADEQGAAGVPGQRRVEGDGEAVSRPEKTDSSEPAVGSESLVIFDEKAGTMKATVKDEHVEKRIRDLVALKNKLKVEKGKLPRS